MFVCMCVCAPHICGVLGGRKRALDCDSPCQFVNCHVDAGTEPRSSAKSVKGFYH